MNEHRNKFSIFCLTLLLIFTTAGSFFGSFAETAAACERISGLRPTHHEPESIEENLPYTPSATFRFSSRQNRTVSSLSRVRPWTPAEFKKDAEFTVKNFPPSICFALPENAESAYTAFCLYTSPVRAGPEYTLSA